VIESTIRHTGVEREEDNKKIFELKSTRFEVGIGDPTTGEYPHFPVPMNKGEERMIDNLSFTVEEVSPKTRTVKIGISQVGQGRNGLCLEQVRKEGDVLLIGSVAEIVLRKFRLDGRPVFRFSVAKDIRVHSRDRMGYRQAS